MAASARIADVGRRLRRKVLWGLTLCSVVPLLVLAYVIQTQVLPGLNPAQSVAYYGFQALLFFTLLGIVGGGWIIWSLARSVQWMTEMMAREPAVADLGERADEIKTVMQSFSKMFETIEHQTAEINSFAMRLDAAYKDLEATNARLKETSFKDDVTSLYNRRFFTIRLDEEVSRHRRFNHPVSVVLLDLDGFKEVNDELGHAVGDETLREVASLLTKHSRGINVVSRYGGDEFCVLLVETAKTGARDYADRIRRLVAAHSFAHGKSLTVSLGVASLPEDDVSAAEELFKLADDALYIAKRSGKNQVGAAPPMEKTAAWNAETS